MQFESITSSECQALMSNGKVAGWARSKNRPKVILHEAEVVKLFYTDHRKWLSQLFHWLLPSPAHAFVKNALCLKKLNIIAPFPMRCFYCSELDCYGVVYNLLPGKTMYEALHEQGSAIIPKWAAFVGELHEKNVYFRAGHARNYLLMDDGQIGLIDIDNLRFGMSFRRCVKNLKYLFDHAKRTGEYSFTPSDVELFMEHYCKASSLSEKQIKKLKNLI